MQSLAIIERPYQFIQDLWLKKIFPVGTSNKNKVILTLSAAISLILTQRIYRLFRPPASLRHLPSVNFFKLAYSILKREDPAVRVRKVFGPAMKKGNGIFAANFPLKWSIYISDPVAAKTLLMKNDIFPKTDDLLKALGDDNPIVQFFGTENVAIVNGEKWKNQRKIMNPAFHRSLPVNTFGQLMLTGIKNIENNDHQVFILDFFQRLTLDALGKGVLGVDFEALTNPDSIWTSTYENVRVGLRNPLPFLFPFVDNHFRFLIPGRTKMVKAVQKLNTLILEMANERRQLVKESMQDNSIPESEKDLLTLMLEAEERGEIKTDNDQLRSNLALFFLAGHETTSNSMSFCLYHLARNKDIQEKARQEVLKIMGDEPKDVLPTTDDIRQFEYIDMILKENLRKNSPAGMLQGRKALKDFELNGKLIPKDTIVIVDINSIHYNPDIWHNPDEFNPERFAVGGEHEQHDGGAWLPFSSGSRQCIGLRFSLAEQRTFLAMLLRKFEWDIPENSVHKNGIRLNNFQFAAPFDLDIKFTPRY
ncbi:cytochrome P450 [Cunninghamella echinulata]|nr:cytochrome P450 [Cunninghamella echinulata]